MSKTISPEKTGPEYPNPQQYYCDNHKYRNFVLHVGCHVAFRVRIGTFDTGHPVVLIIKLQVYIYIYILISVRAQQYFWYIYCLLFITYGQLVLALCHHHALYNVFEYS